MEVENRAEGKFEVPFSALMNIETIITIVNSYFEVRRNSKNYSSYPR